MGASAGGADREFAFNEALGGKDCDLCDDLARISTMTPHSLEVVDANTLYSSLKAIGLSKSQLHALLPDWWDDKAAATSAGAWELVLLLARTLSLDAGKLAVGEIAPTGAVTQIAYKHGREKDAAKLLASSLIASSVAQAILTATSRAPTSFDQNPQAIRKSILSNRDCVDFQGVLTFCWDIGIPVIPLRELPVGLKKMDGAVLRTGDRPVIVVSRKNDSRSWLSFILTHELGHYCLGHLKNDTAIVDVALQAHTTYQTESADDRQEREADEFALEVLGGSDSDALVGRWSPETSPVELAITARDEAARLHCAAGHLILRHAFRTKRWKEAQNALRFLDEDFDAQSTLTEALAGTANLDTLADDLRDLVVKITGLSRNSAPTGSDGSAGNVRGKKRQLR
jgi:hypothetical protein